MRVWRDWQYALVLEASVLWTESSNLSIRTEHSRKAGETTSLLNIYAIVAQRLRRLSQKQQDVGSNPSDSTCSLCLYSPIGRGERLKIS